MDLCEEGIHGLSNLKKWRVKGETLGLGLKLMIPLDIYFIGEKGL